MAEEAGLLGERIADHLDVAVERGHGGQELMSDAALVGGALVLPLLVRGDITGELDEAEHLCVISTDGGDRDVRPELSAVSAHPPPGILDAAVLTGPGQEIAGKAASTILVAVEDREVLSEDLVLRPSFDVLGALVPIDDGAIGGQLHDRDTADLMLPVGRQPAGGSGGRLRRGHRWVQAEVILSLDYPRMRRSSPEEGGSRVPTTA